MDGTDIREAATRRNNSEWSSGPPTEEEQAGVRSRGLIPLLRVGVDLVEDGASIACVVNHVIECTHDDLGRDMTVIWQE